LSCLLSASAQAVTVLKLKDAVYIRASFLEGDMDKVWRLQVNSVEESNRLKVVDFIGERLISSLTPLAETISKYHKTKKILRFGGDESPPVWINGEIAGGNHLLNGSNTVHEYKVDMSLDDAPVYENQIESGGIFKIVEFYQVSLGDGVVVAEVNIIYEFGFNHFANFKYSVTAMKGMKSLAFGGMQFQRPNLIKGEQLILYSPNSEWDVGIDISPPNKVLNLTANLRQKTLAPRTFVVKTSSASAFIMGYCSSDMLDDLESAFYLSKYGKMYPRAVAVRNIPPGNTYGITGFFGFIPQRALFEEGSPCGIRE